MQKGVILDSSGKAIQSTIEKIPDYILVDGGLHLDADIRLEFLRRFKEHTGAIILDLSKLSEKDKKETMTAFKDNMLVYDMDNISPADAIESLANKSKVKPKPTNKGIKKMEKPKQKTKLPNEKELKKSMLAENKRREFIEKNKNKVLHG